MVVYNLDIRRAVGRPAKADAPLSVDPHGMLSGSVTFQRFQIVAWREAQVGQLYGRVQRGQHGGCALDQVGREAFAECSRDGPLCQLAFHALYHVEFVS